MLVDAPSEWGDSKLEDLESQNIWVITVSFPDAPWDCHRTADQARGGLGGQCRHIYGSPMERLGTVSFFFGGHVVISFSKVRTKSGPTIRKPAL